MTIMTAVFDVPDDVWEHNPFDIPTPFGKPQAVARDDLIDKADRLQAENERLRESLKELSRAVRAGYLGRSSKSIEMALEAADALTSGNNQS